MQLSIRYKLSNRQTATSSHLLSCLHKSYHRKSYLQRFIHTLEENIIPPKPKTVIPVLQNASLTEESILRELYANLLSSSMNKKLETSVHPAFVHIINQMSAQDAMLLNSIVEINNSIPVAHVKFTFDTRYLTAVLPHYYSPYFKYSEDKYQISLSIENLSRLQLINLFEGNVVNYDYEKIKTDPFIQKRYEYAKLNNPT